MAVITKVSPLAPKAFPDLPVVKGVQFATAAAGVKYEGRTDVLLAIADAGSTVAGVFTKSATRSAPVLDCQKKRAVSSEAGAAILVNSGNANAFTGKFGFASVGAITNAVSAITNTPTERVFTSSTGVIGEPLPHDRVIAVVDELHSNLSEHGLKDAAHAIMTTDTYAKGASAVVETPAGRVNIAGIAKGSGMIAPDMATMLVYIFTDAKIDQTVLQQMISSITDQTFNCITVDSDTSTSDTLLAVATGASGIVITEKDQEFYAGLNSVMLELAHLVVRDGEGATKFVEINVVGADNDEDAKTHAMAIANSPLIKTAIAGEDPNWGRVVMAIGKSGAAADRDRLSISFGNILVAKDGWVADGYREDDGATYMQNDHIVINVDVGLGEGKSTAWTCDLTHGYIEINADYRS